MKRQVPLLITLIVGLLLIVAVWVPPLQEAQENSTLFFDIIAVFAYFLGGGNLIRVHLTKVARQKPEWVYSAVTLFGFLLMLSAGLFKIGNPLGKTGAIDATGSWYQQLFFYVMSPLNSTMYALLAFFVASASYRAFRAKNREATILLVAAFIILLGQTPFGTLVTSWIPNSLTIFNIPDLAMWIMRGANQAGQRAIMIGISLGVVSMSLRVILGIERTYLGEDRG